MVTNWMLVFVHLDRHEFDEAERSIEAFAELNAKRNPTRGAMTGTMKAILRARLDIARGRQEAALATLAEAEPLAAALDPSANDDLISLRALMKAEAALAAGRADDALAAAEGFVLRQLRQRPASPTSLPITSRSSRTSWRARIGRRATSTGPPPNTGSS
ncbi:MAG: hypothetical protein MZV70_70355 [Desulfobacterales bacterium]|nr:hypothetical protein [Desulfobacterales bacterium]